MTDPITIARAQAAIENGLIEALQSQAQADMDGTTVIVSRQACDEAAEFLPALYDEVKRLRAALEIITMMHDGNPPLPLADMPSVEYARRTIRNIHQEARAALKGTSE